MKIVKKSESRILNRPFERKTYKLLSHKFSKPIESIVFYLSLLPTGRFDKHHHINSDELIFFPNGGKMRVNGELYNLDSWDAILLEPGDEHGLDIIDKDTVHLAIKMPDVDDKVS